MTELQTSLTLTAQEHEFLVQLLQEALKETRVEEHRTRTLSYREHIVKHAELIASMLSKMGHTPE